MSFTPRQRHAVRAEGAVVPIVKGWITGMANDVTSLGVLALAEDQF